MGCGLIASAYQLVRNANLPAPLQTYLVRNSGAGAGF